MDQENTLHLVKIFADIAHGEQKRKYTGERYIVHPVRVMEICKTVTDDIPTLVGALLHDVFEDTTTTEAEVRKFLRELMTEEETEEVILIIHELTDEFIKEKYPQWNREKRKKFEAERLGTITAKSQTIKYADVYDNTEDILAYDRKFSFTYVPEAMDMMTQMKRGNKTLRKKALEGIMVALEKLDL